MKKYVEFVYPGVFVSESSYVEISDAKFLHSEMIAIPPKSFGFRFVERNEIVTDTEILVGSYREKSGWYYIGKKYSKNDIAQSDGEDSILFRNMKNNHYAYVVKTKCGQAFPLHADDVVLEQP
jgi:hypothetical protein